MADREQMEQGRFYAWLSGATRGPDVGAWYLDEETSLRSRQDCEDLIALLERVKERLPE